MTDQDPVAHATPFNFVSVAEDIAADPSDIRLLKKARFWVEDCDAFHKNCGVLASSPTILLYVGADASSPVYLVEGVGSVKYAAFSHC